MTISTRQLCNSEFCQDARCCLLRVAFRSFHPRGRALLPLASSLQVVPPLKLVFSLHDGTTRSAAKLSMKHLKNLGEGSKFRSDCGAPFTLSTRTSSWQQDAGVFMVQGCTLPAASRTEALGSGD